MMSPDVFPPPLTVISRRELERLEERLDFWRRAAMCFAVAAFLAVSALLLR